MLRFPVLGTLRRSRKDLLLIEFMCVLEALEARVALELHVLSRGLGAVWDYFKHDFGVSLVDLRGPGVCLGGLWARSSEGSQNSGQIEVSMGGQEVTLEPQRVSKERPRAPLEPIGAAMAAF